MKNQIILTFIVLISISIFLTVGKKLELNKEKNNYTKEEINIEKRINIFKWITKKEYRRSYLKLN